MKHIAIGLAILQMLAPSCQIALKPFDMLASTADRLHDSTESRNGRIQEIMQRKIMEQNEAIGNILQVSQTNKILAYKLLKLIKYCRSLLERHKKPDKVEIFLPNRRNNANYDKTQEDTANRDKTLDICLPNRRINANYAKAQEDTANRDKKIDIFLPNRQSNANYAKTIVQEDTANRDKTLDIFLPNRRINANYAKAQEDTANRDKKLDIFLPNRQSNANYAKTIVQEDTANRDKTLDIFLPNRQRNAYYDKTIAQKDTANRDKKLDIFLPNRQSNANYYKTIAQEDKTLDIEEDTPIVSMIKYGMRMSKLGRLFLDVISNEFSDQIKPVLGVISSTEVSTM